jgi:hypothetical protein
MRSAVTVVTIALAACLTGCCAFAPCHTGTRAYGAVSALPSGEPVPGATLSLYGTNFASSSSGCFKVSLSSALPFAFSASAPGYKRAEALAEPGFFKVAVVLAPAASDAISTIAWSKVSEAEFNSAPSCT